MNVIEHVIENLKAARSWLTTNGWVQGQMFARRGEAYIDIAEKPCAACLYGAVIITDYIAGRDTFVTPEAVMGELQATLGDVATSGSAVAFNDDPARTSLDEVLDLIDRTLARLEVAA